MTYTHSIAVAFDQLLNTILAGFPDETLSARVWRYYKRTNHILPVKIINTLFFWQKNHCMSAFDNEVQRKHQPREYATREDWRYYDNID